MEQGCVPTAVQLWGGMVRTACSYRHETVSKTSRRHAKRTDKPWKEKFLTERGRVFLSQMPPSAPHFKCLQLDKCAEPGLYSKALCCEFCLTCATGCVRCMSHKYEPVNEFDEQLESDMQKGSLVSRVKDAYDRCSSDSDNEASVDDDDHRMRAEARKMAERWQSMRKHRDDSEGEDEDA